MYAHRITNPRCDGCGKKSSGYFKHGDKIYCGEECYSTSCIKCRTLFSMKFFKTEKETISCSSCGKHVRKYFNDEILLHCSNCKKMMEKYIARRCVTCEKFFCSRWSCVQIYHCNHFHCHKCASICCSCGYLTCATEEACDLCQKPMCPDCSVKCDSCQKVAHTGHFLRMEYQWVCDKCFLGRSSEKLYEDFDFILGCLLGITTL